MWMKSLSVALKMKIVEACFSLVLIHALLYFLQGLFKDNMQPRSQGLSSLAPWDVKRRDPGNEVG